MEVLKGIPASPGIAIGRAYTYVKELKVVDRGASGINVEKELKRFKEALEKSRGQLVKIKDKTLRKLGQKEAEIFQAQFLMLEDPAFITEVENRIKSGKSAELSVQEVVKKFVATFDSMESPYFRERAADIRDVGERVIRNFIGEYQVSLANIKEEVIIVAKALTPSDTASLNPKKVLGFATDLGGATSHTAIIARELGIPAVVGIGNVTEKVQHGDLVIVDGHKGLVLINPDQETLNQYLGINLRVKKHLEELKSFSSVPAKTKDGHRVEVAANVGVLNEVEYALSYGADGIGLLRTEFLYLNRNSLPTEEEQFEAYRSVAEKMGKKPVIIRTLDVGGDKPLPYLQIPEETNPFLGWRAIRICLAKPDIFKTQLRAVLRASTYGNLKIMYPMIASLRELQNANKILNEAKMELKSDGIPFNEKIEVGMMIETPSAAIMAGLLAKEVSFFSVGTNDLTQYVLAVDRTNQNVSGLYDALHPAVLRLIKKTVNAAHAEGRWVGICGELACDLVAIPILVGLGLDEFSMNPSSIPEAKKLIRSISYSEAKEIAVKSLSLSEAEHVRKFVRNLYRLP
jgi:phosphotransferase system enzyme I (PtsI)